MWASKNDLFKILDIYCREESSSGKFNCSPLAPLASLLFSRDWGFAGLSLSGVTALCPWARHINPCLVLVQPRKISPSITEKLLTGI